jgi:light-regulated signal transduction histidine kinase (bacteriophytochrome)
VKRDPRIQPRRPEIRNFRPEGEGSEEDADEDREGPWARLSELVSPLEEDRADGVLAHVKETCFDEMASFREVTWAAFEAITQGANQELRQVLTPVQHLIELKLMQTDPDEPPLAREEARQLLEAIQECGRLLDAQLSHDEITRSFLDVDPQPVELSEEIEAHLSRTGMGGTVETDLEAAPTQVDDERFGESLLVLVDSFVEPAEDEQPIVTCRWQGDEVAVFIGARPPVEPRHALQERLNQPASIRDPGLDIPLARAMIEAQDGDVLVHETADGAVGLRCVFPALESSTPTRSRG